MSRAEIIKKLQLYKAKPDVFQPLSPTELADLVVIVLAQVNEIEKQIKSGNDFATKELTTAINKAIKEHRAENTRLEREIEAVKQEKVLKIAETVDAKLAEADSAINTALANLQKRVDSIRDGEVTEAEVERAATIALSMLELPDFEKLVSTEITSNGPAIRDALELLTGDERYKVEIADVQGLADALNQLNRSNGAGTIGKGQVYGFIRQAVADGTIPTGSLPSGGTTGQVLRKQSNADGDADWETIGGTGIVETIVAGTGITVDDTDPANPVVSATGGGGSGITRSVNSISTPTTAGATALTDYVYFVTNTTLTLPTAVGNTNRYTVKCVSGTCTVDGNGSETIDGTATITFTAQSSVDLISDGTNFNVV